MLLKSYVKVICHGAFGLQEHCMLTFRFTKKILLTLGFQWPRGYPRWCLVSPTSCLHSVLSTDCSSVALIVTIYSLFGPSNVSLAYFIVVVLQSLSTTSMLVLACLGFQYFNESKSNINFLNVFYVYSSGENQFFNNWFVFSHLSRHAPSLL